MIAYAMLLKYTHEIKYINIINELITYENSLFSLKENNWRDMRNQQEEVFCKFWCNGAAGILLSRLKLFELEEFKDNSKIRKDIQSLEYYLILRMIHNYVSVMVLLDNTG